MSDSPDKPNEEVNEADNASPQETATANQTPCCKEEAEALKQFLREETSRTRRGVTVTYTIGICVGALLTFYMFFIINSFKATLDADQIAEIIATEVEYYVPEFVREVETDLAAQAEPLADSLSQEFLALVPQFAAEGKAQIDRTHEEMIPFLSEEFSAIVSDYIDANGAALQALAEDHSNEEFASYFTEAMLEELEIQLNRHLQDSYEGRDLSYFQENLTLGLQAMDAKLTELLEADPKDLDRRELLQRKLLARLFMSALEASE